MNDCQFCLSTAPLDRRGTISNPASIPMFADCASDEMSAKTSDHITIGRYCYLMTKA